MGATSACISTSNGRAPSTPANTEAPGAAAASRPPRNRDDGFGDLREAAASHFEHPDLIGRAEAVFRRAQKAEGVRAVALERKDRVDHVLDDAGSGDLAVLGDVPDDQQRRAARLGEPDQGLGGAANLTDRARRRFDRVAPHRLDGIDDHEFRGVAGGERRHDVLDEGLGGELDRRARQTEAGGPQANLGGRFLARDVDDPAAGSRHRRTGLDQKRRLANARLAPDQGRRSRHKASPRDAIEFADSGGDARIWPRGAGQVLQRKSAPRRPASRGFAPPTPSAAASSMIVFHSPQDSHLPCQRWVIAPQFWQT